MRTARSLSLHFLPRLVAVVGLAAIALVVGVVAYLHQSMGRAQIVASAERFNQTLAVTLSRVVAGSLAEAIALEKSTGVIHPEIKRALDDTFAAMGADSNVLKVKLYNLAGATIYSTNPRDVGESKYDNRDFRRARQGEVATAHGFRPRFQALTQTLADRHVAWTYLPLRAGGAARAQIGVLEIYFDISDEIAASNRSVWAILGVAIPCLFAFYAILLVLVTRHARAIEGAHARNLALAADVARANAASEAKSHFLMTVSHELRTPLNAIIGFSQMMKEQVLGPLGNPRYAGYARDVHAAGAHLLSLINEIIDATALHEGKLKLDLAPCDAVALAREVVEALAPLARAKRQSLALAGTDPAIACVTDAKRFRQILYNLAGNAVKFAGEGGAVRVSLEADRRAPSLRIVVADDGPGISAQDVQKCLAPFGQLKGPAIAGRGLGLGLSLSKSLAEAMGGALELASVEGRGTKVTVTLPWRDAPTTAGEPAAAAAPANAPRVLLHPA